MERDVDGLGRCRRGPRTQRCHLLGGLYNCTMSARSYDKAKETYGKAKEAYDKEQDLSTRALTFENIYKLVTIGNT